MIFPTGFYNTFSTHDYCPFPSDEEASACKKRSPARAATHQITEVAEGRKAQIIYNKRDNEIDLTNIFSKKMVSLISSEERYILNLNNLHHIQDVLRELYEKMRSTPERVNEITMEVLSKGLAYSILPSNFTLDLPFAVKNAEGTLETLFTSYHIREVVLYRGNRTFILEPLEENGAPPMLIFRGTTPECPGSLETNFDLPAMLFGRGHSIIKRNKALLHQELIDLYAKHNKRVVVGGHSLGGILAQRLFVEDKNYELIEKGYVYSIPGIPRVQYRQWCHLLQEGKVTKDAFTVINIEGDPCNLVGNPAYFMGEKYIFERVGKIWNTIHGDCVTSGPEPLVVKKVKPAPYYTPLREFLRVVCSPRNILVFLWHVSTIAFRILFIDLPFSVYHSVARFRKKWSTFGEHTLVLRNSLFAYVVGKFYSLETRDLIDRIIKRIGPPTRDSC